MVAGGGGGYWGNGCDIVEEVEDVGEGYRQSHNAQATCVMI